MFADQFYVVLDDCDVDGEVRLHATVDDSRLHSHIIMACKAEAVEELLYAQQFE